MSILSSIVTDISKLRVVSRLTSSKEVDKLKIVEAIKMALRTAWIPGYGLAAVQIGIPIKAAWYWIPDKKGEYHPEYGQCRQVTLINPKILEQSEFVVKPGEGCLSLPHQLLNVGRYHKITYENDGIVCEAQGIEAQIIQHEVDHTNGILIVDREYKTSRIGRNDPCSCGSGKKFKKCCGK